MTVHDPYFKKIFVKRTKYTADGHRLDGLNDLIAQKPTPAILGANYSVKQSRGCSCWGFNPSKVFEFSLNEPDFFKNLEEITENAGFYQNKPKVYDPAGRIIDNLPAYLYLPGLIGYIGYELGRKIEKIPGLAADDLALPVIRFAYYDKLICYDHHSQHFWVLCTDDQATLDELEIIIEKALARNIKKLPAGKIEQLWAEQLNCNITRDQYFDSIEKILRYIYDGQVYQINFSQRFDTDFIADPVNLFHWQNNHNPSGYSAYLDCGNFKIVSASPELFLQTQNGRIATRPIKGTRKRYPQKGPDTEKNRQMNQHNYQQLLNSEKDQAELNMIIDLERNDLGRICEPGTRKVTVPRVIELCPTVIHAAAQIEGQLRQQISFTDILRATFPGGSITGAPKIRAMQIIDQLEPTFRSVYTGSIGYIGPGQSLALNIAIRTVIITRNKAYIQAGGGIVADSEPEKEWEETLVKAAALVCGVNAVNGI